MVAGVERAGVEERALLADGVGGWDAVEMMVGGGGGGRGVRRAG